MGKTHSTFASARMNLIITFALGVLMLEAGGPVVRGQPDKPTAPTETDKPDDPCTCDTTKDDPVCGTDGKTYQNSECLKCAKINDDQPDLKASSQGCCPDDWVWYWCVDRSEKKGVRGLRSVQKNEMEERSWE